MLVLSRKKRRVHHHRESVTITVIEVRGDKVRLGIDAPRDVPVHREEVADQIRAARAAGASEAPAPAVRLPQPDLAVPAR